VDKKKPLSEDSGFSGWIFRRLERDAFSTFGHEALELEARA
jgi:hypothetical protein